MTNKKCLVILSGGQDSTTCLFWAKERFEEVHAITFNYGQRHAIEIASAIKVAKMAEVASHEVVELGPILKSASPLTSDNELEQYENAEQMAQVIGNRCELTFVPARNMLFFTIGLNRAVALGCDNLVTGICQEDNANYFDCRDVFRYYFQRAANRSVGCDAAPPIEEKFQLIAPLMRLSKADTCRMAYSMPACREALAYTHTSYDGKYPPTDMNHANVLRAAGFEAAGLPDPLVVRAWREGLMELPATRNYDSLTAEQYPE